MIYYFSGTGNSLYVARHLADALGERLCPMTFPASTDDKVIGLVFPVYGWGIPNVVEKVAPLLLPRGGENTPPFGEVGRGLAFLDPARRDNAGRKMVALEDCTPDVVAMQDWLLENAHIVMVKLSPMLDISMLLRKLTHVKEIHVVSVRGECKELLVVLSKDIERRKLFCVNLESDDPAITRSLDEKTTRLPELADEMGAFLYEPNASVLKAGVQDSVGQQLGLRKLHPNSNLFTGNEWRTNFPGRSFAVEGTSGFGKRELKAFLQGITQANITVRNFPASTAELRKKLDLKEGGETYLFATTMKDGQHRLVRCRKAI